MSFFEAEEFCQSLHEETGLAEIHHESDQNLITAALKEHNLSQYDWWAGATDEYQVPRIFLKTFSIKVVWILQFLGYLRTLSLKFQKARTKIGVFLAQPCRLSQLN